MFVKIGEIVTLVSVQRRSLLLDGNGLLDFSPPIH